jgi:hypothetical protein
MPTKKVEGDKGKPLERGRFARILANGFVIDVTPPAEGAPKGKPTSPKPKG